MKRSAASAWAWRLATASMAWQLKISSKAARKAKRKYQAKISIGVK